MKAMSNAHRPETSYDEDCKGTYSIGVHITDDWEKYRELQSMKSKRE